MYRSPSWRSLLFAATFLFFGTTALADYGAGRKAWDAGRPAEALKQWQAAADREDRRAMLALGQLYLQGLGAPQDYVLAHMWFNLAASRGAKEAIGQRDALAAKMTPQQIASAQDRARAWRPDGAAAAPNAAPAPRRTASSPPAAPPPPRAIREAQALLTTLGYKAGAADGKWGARTGRAYAAFLRDAGLPPGKVLTPDALRAMRAAARKRNVAVPAAPAGRKPAGKRQADLHRIVAAGDVDGLKAALKRDVDVNARDGKGWTALMRAVDKGYALMVPPLLAAKADPNVRLADGATGLFIAVLSGHSEIVAWLLKAGADPYVKGPKGRTAADVAAIKKISLGFRDCDGCPEMAVVPAGSFTMGSPSDEKGRWDNEGPQHRVRIAKPFAVGRYEVTFAEWNACLAEGGCNGHRPGEKGWGRGRRPVINVSWKDAQSYVRWLSRKTGKRYRLLSEAQWEYAARAGTTGPFHTGPTISKDQANYQRRLTVPVGSFPANGFGLHDVHGNVWEWVEDCWHGNYGGAPSDGGAWTSGGNCDRRVLRGGSWNDGPRYLRAANRFANWTGYRSNYIGFRVARTLAP